MQIPFTIEVVKAELNLGTINLTNVFHFHEDRLAIEMTISLADTKLHTPSTLP